MKILHIISGDLWAGAEVQVATLLKELVRRHDVFAVVLNAGRLESELNSVGVKVTVLPESSRSFLHLLRGIKGIIKQINPDVVHTHRQKENILGGLACALSTKIVCVKTVHGSSEFSLNWKQRFQRFVDECIGRCLQKGIISVSQTLAAELALIYGKDKIHTISNGIDVDEVVKDSQQKVEQRLSDRIHICLIGRMVQVKRVDLFLLAAKLLLEDKRYRQVVDFHVFGDGPMLEKYKEEAVSYEIQKFVTFHGHCSDIRSRLQTMDIVVMTSDHEGLPMTALEALALGKPLVAHAVGGLVPLLTSAFPQGLVEQHSAKGYFEALSNMLDRLESLHSPTLPQEFYASHNAEQVELLYLKLSTELVGKFE
ncbi:glycosyltransferase [Alteromonas sp. S167]|uniref:glycosyltransferase n=1 Tax=Alteromonas sp. S167 TaxID=3117402 RepID=UPI002FE08368